MQNNYFGYVNIKYLEKNDKKSQCKRTKKDIQVGDPAWVLTSSSYPKRSYPGNNKSDRLIYYRPKKYSNEAAFELFLRKPHELFRMIKPLKKETNKSLNTIIQEQVQGWVNQAANHLSQFSQSSNDDFFDKLKGYCVSYFRAFSKVNQNIQKSISATTDFGFNPDTEDYFTKKLICAFEFDHKAISNKFHGIKELVGVFKQFKDKFDFHQFLTHEDYFRREIAKYLVSADLEKDSSILTGELIKHIYVNCNSSILKWDKIKVSPDAQVYVPFGPNCTPNFSSGQGPIGTGC